MDRFLISYYENLSDPQPTVRLIENIGVLLNLIGEAGEDGLQITVEKIADTQRLIDWRRPAAHPTPDWDDTFESGIVIPDEPDVPRAGSDLRREAEKIG